MRVIFAGTPTFATIHLQYLLTQKDHEIIAVFTQPDRPAGRGKMLQASPVKQLAEQHNFPIYQPLSLKEASTQCDIQKLNADVMVVVAYGLILPQAVLNLPKHGCINVHGSLLPRWRGAAPIQRTIEAGDSESGITIMQMDKGLDTGDMLLKVCCEIAPNDTAASLHDKLAAIGGNALITTLNQMNAKTLLPEKQNSALATYAEKITKAEAKLDWSLPAETLDRKIRAFNPFPISFFNLGAQVIRVWDAAVLSQASNNNAGTITRITKDGIDVCTGSNLLRLKTLQLPSKKPMAISQIINGNKDLFVVGKTLKN